MNENRISHQIEEYISYKHSLGFKLLGESSVLRSFARYTISAGYNGSLTRDIVLEWASANTNSYKTMGRRIEVIRPFAKYAHSFDHGAEIISNLIYHNVHDRPTPYIFSEAEIQQLMEECKTLYSPDGVRAYSIKTIIGLLWSTGLRPSEPINLHVEDVDLDHEILHIRKTKFSKERYIPIDSTVVAKLAEYKQWITRQLGKKNPADAFFYTTWGKPLNKPALSYAFKQIRRSIDAKPSGYKYVRLYDLRHTMACNTIKRWIAQGKDVNAQLHILSTYLGHVKPEDTYWYLSSTSDLMNLCCSKYETMFGGDLDEI